MGKILVICGPTSTGKTQLGFKLARRFSGQIISADSRQVYKYMDIGTGKERSSDIPIWGYDLVDPKEDFSVSEFVKMATKEMNLVQSRGLLPIVVGGTGLYIKGLFEKMETLNIPKNDNLRKELENKGVSSLFEQLATLDPTRAASLNLSDRKNPRRLIRGIEVATFKIDNPDFAEKIDHLRNNNEVLYIGLKPDLVLISQKILRKVDERINQGFIDEVEFLLKYGVSWKMQSMKSIGYKEAEGFFKHGLSYEEFVSHWYLSETQYVKRQMTWFKKVKDVNWFESEDPYLYEKVENMVEKWDNNANDKEN